MKFGVSIGFQNPPQWGLPWPDLYAETIEFVRQAEAFGIDHVWLSEHHFVDDGYCPSLMPACAAIASATTKIRIGTKVVLLPFHNPVRLAEDAAVVDVLSNGRLDLGVAAGYRREEFIGFDVRRSERGARMREGLDVLVRALSGERVNHRGDFFTFSDVEISPPPVQRPVPLWLGGRTRAAMRRAAEYGAHLALSDFIAENCRVDYDNYVQALDELGRDPGAYEVSVVSSALLDHDAERAWHIAGPHLLYQQNQYQQWFKEVRDRSSDDFALASSLDDLRDGSFLVGRPNDVVEQVRAFHRQVPFTHLSVWCLLPGLRLEHALGSLELLANEVIPALRDL